MERRDKGERQSTLYLDIDGVIFPYFHEDVYHGRNNQNYNLRTEWVNDREFYYPEVVQALGSIAARSLVVLSSSRMAAFLHQPEYKGVVETLQLEGALFIDHHQPGRIEYKQEAVYRHWSRTPGEGVHEVFRRGIAHKDTGCPLGAEGLRAVWIDDHITDLPVGELVNGGSIEHVAPQQYTGLTLDDVARLVPLLN